MTRFVRATLIALLLATGATAHAGTVACNTATTLTAVNTCTPDIKLYIPGTALGGALATVVTSDLFDTTTTPITSILDNGSPNGNATGGAKTVNAWYGMSKQYAGKRLFVVFNPYNGAGAGVSHLLVTEDPTKTVLIPEADVVTIGPVKSGYTTFSNNCAVDGSSTTLAPVIACTSHAPTQADMAVSDLNATELYKLETPTSGSMRALTTLASTPLAVQGFGVAVNSNLYSALQTANLAEGLIPPSCTAGDTTAACQPNIRSSDYTSLVTKSGTFKSAASLLHNTDATQLILARFSDLSGVQAASNIFFADNPCRAAVDSKGKPIKGVLGGALDIASTTDTTPALVVQANATTNAIVSALNAASGYAIGVLSLATVPGSSDTWKYIKLDGLSPNFNLDGSIDTYQRNAFARGDYPFAMTFYAVTPTKATAKGAAALYPNVITAVVNGLKDSTLHNFTGIGYLDGAANDEQSLYDRTNGNNCSPLIRNSTVNFATAAPAPATVIGVSSGSTYNVAVTPSWTDEAGTTSTATLDGTAYTKGTAISANGAHALVVTTTKTSNGLTALTTVNFTIDAVAPTPATVTGVSSGSTYTASVTPSWTDAAGTTSTATLDGTAYTNGTAISANGAHTLVVTTTKSSNGLTAQTTISFTINGGPTPVTVTGVTSGSTYYAPVIPSWTDAAGTTSTATLDGTAYTKGTAISANGAHALVVTTTKISNGLTALTTVNFTIDTVAPTPVTVTGVSSGSTYASATPSWTDAVGTSSTATLDGTAYTKGTAISANGAHAFVVTTTKTSNGLTALTTVNFTIDTVAPTPVTVTGVSFGSTYNAAVTPNWTDAAGTTSTATLDGTAYTKGTAISANGANTLVVTTIKTSNGLMAQTTISFTIASLPSGYVSEGGLTWMPNYIGQGATYGTPVMLASYPNNHWFTWPEANAYCTGGNFQGLTGWRLPTIHELDRFANSAALYSSGAMNGQGWTLSNTWSSAPGSAGIHYYVSLSSGLVYGRYDTYKSYVTCVR